MGEDRRNDPEFLRHEITTEIGTCIILPKMVIIAEAVDELVAKRLVAEYDAFKDAPLEPTDVPDPAWIDPDSEMEL
jgi:hypothetical protein